MEQQSTYEEDQRTAENATGHNKKSSTEHNHQEALPPLRQLTSP